MKRRILFAASLAAVLGGVVWAVLPPPEPPGPVYEGHTVGYRLRHPKIIKVTGGLSGSYKVKWPKLGTNALPFLTQALEAKDGAMPLCRVGESRLQILFTKPVPNWLVRRNAGNLLRNMGNDARPAIPALIQALRIDENAEVRFSAARTLEQVGQGDERVSKALADALEDKAPEVRRLAASALLLIDPEAAAKAGVK